MHAETKERAYLRLALKIAEAATEPPKEPVIDPAKVHQLTIYKDCDEMVETPRDVYPYAAWLEMERRRIAGLWEETWIQKRRRRRHLPEIALFARGWRGKSRIA